MGNELRKPGAGVVEVDHLSGPIPIIDVLCSRRSHVAFTVDALLCVTNFSLQRTLHSVVSFNEFSDAISLDFRRSVLLLFLRICLNFIPKYNYCEFEKRRYELNYLLFFEEFPLLFQFFPLR